MLFVCAEEAMRVKETRFPEAGRLRRDVDIVPQSQWCFDTTVRYATGEMDLKLTNVTTWTRHWYAYVNIFPLQVTFCLAVPLDPNNSPSGIRHLQLARAALALQTQRH